MGAMNRGLNLPAIQRIMNEFEKENATMDMKEEMMSDAVDDAMDAEEDEEEEGDKILKEVLDEIGVDLSQQVSSGYLPPNCSAYKSLVNGCANRHCLGDFSANQQTSSRAGRIRCRAVLCRQCGWRFLDTQTYVR